LIYTPIWGAAVGLVMLTGAAERWGDPELLALSIALTAGAIVPAFSSRGAMKLALSVVGFAFLMNYFLTPYFFDVLHMHYGFNTDINIDNNPLFLYFMTVPYFATYAALISIGYRWAARIERRTLRAIAIASVPLAVAFLETALNANPFMKSLFCFDDLSLMLTFGTLSYGTALACAMPLWVNIDDHTPLRTVLVGLLASMMAMVICFELLRHAVAPHVTAVEEGAIGLRDYEGSCLSAPLGRRR